MTDREPPAFPRVSDSPADEKTVVSEPSSGIFSRPDTAPGASVAAPAPPPPAGGTPLTSRDSRVRWAIVGIATLLVVALIGAFLVFAAPKGGTPSTVARYAPGDAVTYVEARLDLPGDQHTALAAFMSHFPGFADQAAFDQKFDETINQLLASAEAPVSWQSDIKPWFGGQVGLFSSSLNQDPGTPPSMTVALSVKDTAAFDAFLTAHLQPGAQSETYEGQVIWTGTLFQDGGRVSLAATNDAVVVALRIEDVKPALDAHADRNPGLADDAFFLQQLGTLPADHLGLVYYDGRAAAQQLRDQFDQLGSQLGTTQVPTGLLNWLIDTASSRSLGVLRADSDHLTLTTRGERPANADLPPLPANRTSTLAALVPAQSLAYVEMHDVGQTVKFVLNKFLEAQPGASPPIDLKDIDQVLGVSIPDYFDFITDVGVSYSNIDGDQLFGLVATVDDPAIAKSRVEKLMTLARSLVLLGAGVSFEDKDFHGVQGTVIKFDTGAQSALGGIAVVLNGNNLVIGNEEFADFATGGHDAGATLADRAEFAQGLAAGGASNAGVMFADVGALRGLAEGLMSDADKAKYELNAKPFLEPLSHVMVVNTTDGNTSVGHVFLYVK